MAGGLRALPAPCVPQSLRRRIAQAVLERGAKVTLLVQPARNRIALIAPRRGARRCNCFVAVRIPNKSDSASQLSLQGFTLAKPDLW